MAGLMHKVGEPLIHIVIPDASKQIDGVCESRNVLERRKAEQSMIVINHCQVEEKLARHWNFPLVAIAAKIDGYQVFVSEAKCYV